MIEWAVIAEKLRFASSDAMWKALYVEQRLSITKIAERFGVSRNTVRGELLKRGLLRKQGGPNNVTGVELTSDLIDEIRREGVLAVAKRLGINYTTLYKRLRKLGLSVTDLRTSSDFVRKV